LQFFKVTEVIYILSDATAMFINMPFDKEYNILSKNLYLPKGYTAWKNFQENVQSLEGESSADRHPGSGRP